MARHTATSVVMHRISRRKATRAEWYAWKRYWSLLMREGPTERTKQAEKLLTLAIACAVAREGMRNLTEPMHELGRTFARLAPTMRRFNEITNRALAE